MEYFQFALGAGPERFFGVLVLTCIILFAAVRVCTTMMIALGHILGRR